MKKAKRKSLLKAKIGRDARTGEFIPVKEAKRRPSTTVVETIKHGKYKAKKKSGSGHGGTRSTGPRRTK